MVPPCVKGRAWSAGALCVCHAELVTRPRQAGLARVKQDADRSGLSNTEMADPSAVRDFAQATEDLGHGHLSAWEHVVGVDLTNRPDWAGPPTLQPIHEPLVLFGYVAAAIHRQELVTQGAGPAAAPDGAGGQTGRRGRCAVRGAATPGGGVGLGAAGVRCVGAALSDRGRRVEEQITVLRPCSLRRW
jgi:hypothetical protein